VTSAGAKYLLLKYTQKVSTQPSFLELSFKNDRIEKRGEELSQLEGKQTGNEILFSRQCLDKEWSLLLRGKKWRS